MLLLRSPTSLSILLGVPTGLFLAAIATVARWEASAFAQTRNEDNGPPVKQVVSSPARTHRFSPLVQVIAFGIGLLLIFAGLLWFYGIFGPLSVFLCFAMAFRATDGIIEILGIKGYLLMRKVDDTLQHQDALPSSTKGGLVIPALLIVCGSVLPLSLHFQLSLFPACFLFITFFTYSSAAILNTTQRGEKLKTTLFNICGMTALLCVMLSLFVALILWAISLDNGKSEDDTPKPQTLVDHIVMYTWALQIFSAIGQICSVVSSLYRLDVVLSRTPKPRTRVESVGGRRGPIRVSQFAMSETLGPPVSVPCVREMLVNRRQDLVRPRYAAVGVATIGLSMIASLCIARTYLPDRMFHPIIPAYQADAEFTALSVGAIVSPFLVAITTAIMSYCRNESTFVWNSEAYWSAGNLQAQELSRLDPESEVTDALLGP